MNIYHIRSLPTTSASFYEMGQPSSKGSSTSRMSHNQQLAHRAHIEQPIPAEPTFKHRENRKFVKFFLQCSRRFGRLVGLSRSQNQRDYRRVVSRFREENLTTKELELIRQELAHLSHRPFIRRDARLYLSIVKRFLNQDSRQELREMFNDPLLGRTAFLNHHANYIALKNKVWWPHDSGILKVIDDLRAFVEAHPDDCYGRLLLALSLYEGLRDFKSAVEVLEQLYLRFPDYSAGISVLAELYRLTRFQRTAAEFSEEAYEKNPQNLHAAQLALLLGSRKVDPDNIPAGHFHAIDSLLWWSPLAILFTPYGIQDPETPGTF